MRQQNIVLIDFLKTIFTRESKFRVYSIPFHLTIAKLMKHSMVILILFAMFLCIAEDATIHGDVHSTWGNRNGGYTEASFFGKLFVPKNYYDGTHPKKKFALIKNQVILPNTDRGSIMNVGNNLALLILIMIAAMAYSLCHHMIRFFIWKIVIYLKMPYTIFKHFIRFQPIHILSWDQLDKHYPGKLDTSSIHTKNELGGKNEWLIKD